MPEPTPDKPETTIYRTTLHWALLLGPAMLFAIGGVIIRKWLPLSLIMMAVAIAWGILSVKNLRLSEFILTDSKMIIRIGFPLTRFYELPYTKLGGSDFIKPALGIFLGFGKVWVLQKNNKMLVFRLVAKPDELVEKLKKEIIRAHEASGS